MRDGTGQYPFKCPPCVFPEDPQDALLQDGDLAVLLEVGEDEVQRRAHDLPLQPAVDLVLRERPPGVAEDALDAQDRVEPGVVEDLHGCHDIWYILILYMPFALPEPAEAALRVLPTDEIADGTDGGRRHARRCENGFKWVAKECCAAILRRRWKKAQDTDATEI